MMRIKYIRWISLSLILVAAFVIKNHSAFNFSIYSPFFFEKIGYNGL